MDDKATDLESLKTTKQDNEEESIHGYKLVHRRSYAPPCIVGCGRPPPQRYVPHTTQWIVWDDEGGSRPPPAPELCSATALHFCRTGAEAALFCDNVDSLALLRVRPVRWPTATRDTPLFVECRGDAAALTFSKCGAHGLRVDDEVTDADERRKLLSGDVEGIDSRRPCSKWTYTVDNGYIVHKRSVDVLDNCTYDASTPRGKFHAVHWYEYLYPVAVGVEDANGRFTLPDVQPVTRTDNVCSLVKGRCGDDVGSNGSDKTMDEPIVVYTESLESGCYIVRKRYSLAEIQLAVKRARGEACLG